MSDLRRVHNPTRDAVVYNQTGNTVAGTTSVEADMHDPVTARLVRLGRLIVPPVVEPVPEPVVEQIDTDEWPTGRPKTRSKNKSGDK